MMIEKLGIQLEWQSASHRDFPVLQATDVHLWWLELSLNKQQSEHALGLLSDIQRDKYHRRMTPELQQAYLAGRYYLLTLLGLYSGRAPEEIELSYSRLNKPYLSDRDTQLEFNFTDTQDNGNYFGLFGFNRSGAIGVDIESRNRNFDLNKIVAKKFTDSEKAFIDVDNNKTKHARSLSIWTRKEAYGKAIGQGINFKMNQQNLVSDNTSNAHDVFNFTDVKKQNWRCLPLTLGEDFIATCVHAGHSPLTLSAFNSLKNHQN